MLIRRNFLKKLTTLGGTLSVTPWLSRAIAADINESLLHLNTLTSEEAASDEDVWRSIQQAYTVSPNVINLNNGGVSPQPLIVQDAVDRYYRYSNEAPSYYMWRILNQGREPLREKLADLSNCSPEEVAINRNATEALDTIIFGLQLKEGDAVVLTRQDYPNMMSAYKQRALRDGVQLNWVDLDLPMEDDDAIIAKYMEQVTPNTKVMHITQVINWTGQILPAKKLCAAAKDRGIATVVDGAHAFAHISSDITDIGCDYYGTSLHKWLCAPFGTGMIYVKKENVAGLWPLIPDHDPTRDDIRKFENLGTRSYANELAIGHAIDFHNAIGAERKQARLQYLKNYWVNKVKDHPNIRINTSLLPAYSCALANVAIEGIESIALNNRLFGDYKIHASPVILEGIEGVRITPNVYTKLKDLDKLADALLFIADDKTGKS